MKEGLESKIVGLDVGISVEFVTFSNNTLATLLNARLSPPSLSTSMVLRTKMTYMMDVNGLMKTNCMAEIWQSVITALALASLDVSGGGL